jgi:hypothetical protein
MRPPRSRNAWRGHRARTFGRELLNDTPSWADQVSTSSSAGPPARDRDQLSDRDQSIIGQAHDYAEALSQAAWVIGELLAIIERFADGGAEVTVKSELDEPLGRSQPESGGQFRPRMYEITITGRAGPVLCAAFDDCTVTLGPGTTVLHAQLPDQAALWGLVQRIIGLGLEVVDLHLGSAE